MTPLCSIVCPTHNGPDLAIKMIKSIADAADNQNRVEFVIRIHDDDPKTIAEIPTILAATQNVRVVIGPTLKGYHSLNKFFDEGIAVATGIWYWHLNDDTVLFESKGWDTKLTAEEPDHIVCPQFHRLCDSCYAEDPNIPFALIPIWMMRKYFPQGIPNPPDTGVTDFLRAAGIKTTFLKDVIAWHQRHVTAETEQQRINDAAGRVSP